MSPKTFLLVPTALIAVSVSIEATLLAGVASIGTTTYHMMHLALMAVLIVAQFGVYAYAREHGGPARLALLFAIGASCTGIGDFVNGAASGIEPISHKLSWALLLFGTGYTLYTVALWLHNEPILRGRASNFARWRYLIALPILAVNVAGWQMQVGPNVDGLDLLAWGSFIFNATIYVLLPTFAIWFFHSSGWSVGGLIVLIGAIMIQYSDLILFDSWLRDGNPDVPPFELYAINWIVYFSGQALISIFPALAIQERT
ncbi:MAG: hypothetical protein ACSLFF_10390 [Solirubrobacterales bacterium]